jgi:hypothetical protein
LDKGAPHPQRSANPATIVKAELSTGGGLLFPAGLKLFAFEELLPFPQPSRIVARIGGRQKELVGHNVEGLHDPQLQVESHAGFARFVAAYQAFYGPDGLGRRCDPDKVAISGT